MRPSPPQCSTALAAEYQSNCLLIAQNTDMLKEKKKQKGQEGLKAFPSPKGKQVSKFSQTEQSYSSSLHTAQLLSLLLSQISVSQLQLLDPFNYGDTKQSQPHQRPTPAPLPKVRLGSHGIVQLSPYSWNVPAN